MPTSAHKYFHYDLKNVGDHRLENKLNSICSILHIRTHTPDDVIVMQDYTLIQRCQSGDSRDLP